MILVTTPDEFGEAIKDKGTVGYINIRRKMSSDLLHSGHEMLINYSKSNYDLTAVVFIDFYELVYALYKYDISKTASENLKVWDRDGCLNWLNDHGVDIAYVMRENYFIEWEAANHDLIETTKKWVDQIWIENNYPMHPEYGSNQKMWFLTTKAAMVYFYLAKHFGTYQITTWKNGDIVFIYNHFTKKYIKENKFIVLDPIKDSDNLYFSSSQHKLKNTHKQVIKKFENTIKKIGYADKQLLKDELSKLNIVDKYAIGLEINEIVITDNDLVGTDKLLININYMINGSICNLPLYLDKGDFNAKSKI